MESPAFKEVEMLVTKQLRDIKDQADALKAKNGLDAYTAAHLDDVSRRVDKALQAVMTVK